MYEALLDRLPGDGLVCSFPGGERVRLAAAYRQVTWNAQEYAAFKTDVAPGDVVLDVGANLGAYTLLFAEWTGPSGHVHAFEPAPEARRGLTRHVEINGLQHRVTIRAEAVSAADGTARFRAAGLHGDNRLTSTREESSIEIATTSIDAVCATLDRPPRLVKIDVEGAELDVLKGARHTIAAAGDRLKIYIEMHPHLWSSVGASREALEAELDRQRLTVERLDGSADVWGLEGVCVRVRRCAS
jgi:FkbM family methyltransferase